MFVENLEDLGILFDQMSESVENFFEDCFHETEFCESVRNADWKSGEKLFVFGQDTSIIDQSIANNKITGGNPGSGKGTGRQNR